MLVIFFPSKKQTTEDFRGSKIYPNYICHKTIDLKIHCLKKIKNIYISNYIYIYIYIHIHTQHVWKKNTKRQQNFKINNCLLMFNFHDGMDLLSSFLFSDVSLVTYEPV